MIYRHSIGRFHYIGGGGCHITMYAQCITTYRMRPILSDISIIYWTVPLYSGEVSYNDVCIITTYSMGVPVATVGTGVTLYAFTLHVVLFSYAMGRQHGGVLKYNGVALYIDVCAYVYI